ncbi:hypothetical protein Back11_61780 [Paenibacillus baekrokdamisoli]|uniref:Uncharacterized protein n=1 Tax=Paenibacillus baekrokdamisoli TaxID=1712516 RepID=A0A3G9JIN0_9BACL|nr:hypothetical protein Back11_61780 [Paenibacillus baekrokdamisoli]
MILTLSLVVPYSSPHDKDMKAMTFIGRRYKTEISPTVKVKLVDFKHLKGPDKKDFPPNYQDLLK